MTRWDEMGTGTHTELTEDARDRAALYALGGMRPADVARFEKHLEACAPCRREVSELRPVVEELALAAPEADPPSGLKERVLARARKPFNLQLAAGRGWHASGVPGIDLCQLWLDQRNERHTLLIRMQAGAVLPAHRHSEPEECYVVQGDLRDGDLRLGAGDYIRFEGDTSHSISSQEGCLLFVTASLHDRPVEPSPSARV